MNFDQISKSSVDDFLTYASFNSSEWKLVKKTDDVQVFRKATESQSGSEPFLCECLLNASPQEVADLLNPTKPYRIQWDAFLDRLQVIQSISSDMHLVYHVVKPSLKGLISARDSVNLVTIGENEDCRFIVAVSVELSEHPPVKNYVRIQQRPSGYMIFPVDGEPNQCRFLMVFDADLQMGNLAGKLMPLVKPMLLLEKIANLRKGINTLLNHQ